MLQDSPQVQYGGLEHGNILDCRERDLFIAFVKKNKLSFYLASACLVSCLLLLLFSYVWMVDVTLTTNLCKDDRVIKIVNIMAVFVFVMMSQLILN